MQPAISSRRLGAGLLALAVMLSACLTRAGQETIPQASQPAGAADPGPVAWSGGVQTVRYVVPPAPGPIKPWRGEMVQQVQVVDGYATMMFTLRNVGDEPVAFLNLLYDIEPQHLYDPLVHAYWAYGPKTAQNQAFQNRNGRFFPSPAVLQPGELGVYLMGGKRVSGQGSIGQLKSNIKYCPTRGMDDVQSQSLEVSGLTWQTNGGVTTVRGMLRQAAGNQRYSAPTVGIAFFSASGAFVGAVVGDKVGAPMTPGEQRPFEISGRGIQAGAIARAQGWAWIR